MSTNRLTIPFQRSAGLAKAVRWAIGVIILAVILWRMYTVIVVEAAYGPDTWVRFAITGLILGGMYALIAIGYTLVYGILFMINFAHGDVMMLGGFAGYFVFEALKIVPTPSAADPKLTFINAQPILSI